MKKTTEFNFMGSDPRIMYHTINKPTKNEMLVTGWDPDQNVQPGFVFKNGRDNWVVKEVKERRDHKGIFKNPSDKKESFFSVVCAL